jgi:hypothetical protein
VENLYKVGGSLKRIKAAKKFTSWQGLVSKAGRLFYPRCTPEPIACFSQRLGFVNYSYYQSEQLCSIGSEPLSRAKSKQIGTRL